MRFAPPDESDASDASSINSHLDDDSDFEPPRYSEPVSSLGRRVRGFIDSSDEESGSHSEDDYEIIGLPNVSGINRNGPKASSMSHTSESAWRSGEALGQNIGSLKGKQRAPVAVWEGEQEGREPNSAMTVFLRLTEEKSMREGRKTASDRRAQLKAISQSARQTISQGEQERNRKEDEEMARLLQGLVVQQEKKEKELAEKFLEREKKLWADIDAAIRGVEQREADALAAETRLVKERQAAEGAAAENEAKARRQAAENMAKAKMDQDKADALAKETQVEKDKEEAAAKARREAKEAESAKKGQTSTEWRKWVEKQRWMKAEVIEVVKADKATKSALRVGMRLITRNLGQVTNTRDVVVRVTNDIHKILLEQLPQPPSPSSPVVLDTSTPKSYAYLLSHLSKAIIKQAENEVSAKAEAGFPLARVIVGLFLRGHAALSEILFARLVKKCPWVIPYYPSKQADQSREAYEKSTGRGSDESKADYISRMGGIVTLYFAILQTPLGSLVSSLPAKPSPKELVVLVNPSLRLHASWPWLANSLHDPMPAMEPIAHLVSTWIETAGYETVKRYGQKQCEKILDALYREGIEAGKMKGDGQAAVQRLDLLLVQWKQGGLAKPKGRDWE